MRLWLVGGLIVLLIIAGVGYQALRAPSVDSNPVAQAIFTYDLLIRNVVIVDGSGEDRQYGSIGILGDKITAIGPSIGGLARRVIDGKGLYASPGFIDLGPLAAPNSRKVLMGVTTQVITSLDPAPLRSVALNTNLAWLVDQEGILGQAIGATGGKLTASQVQESTQKLSSALRLGASGTYLRASPAVANWFKTDEAFWDVLMKQGSRLFWQVPVDDPNVRDAVTGLLARSAAHQVSVHLSGINLSHPSNWGRVYDVINLIDRGGAAVSGDIVPYFDRPQVAERDLVVFVSHPSIAIASGSDSRHPAIVGAYPRLLQRFVNQEPILSIEEAVAKSTSLPASVLALDGRGLLRTGYWADIVLFDGSAVHAPEDAIQSSALPQGVHTVIVNGRIAVEAGKETGERAGAILPHKGK